MILELSKHKPKPGVTVFVMKGSVHSGPDCRRIEQETEKAIAAQDLHLIFDLAQVTHIDSAAIGSIVRCFSRLKGAGGALRLSGCTGMIEASLRLTQLHKVLELYPNERAAAENFPPASPR